MKKRLQPTRLGLIVLLALAALAAAPGAASAQWIQIDGTATGKTIPLGNGTFRIVGTYTDASKPGVAGTYVGTYVETTTGYTSCITTGDAVFLCSEGVPTISSCNLIHGEVTFRSQGRMLTLFIASDFSGHLTSGVCLTEDPEIHSVEFRLVGLGEGFSRGYGDINFVEGYMAGSSTPLAGGVYEDSFELHLLVPDVATD
jgi:hypothetical protein